MSDATESATVLPTDQQTGTRAGGQTDEQFLEETRAAEMAEQLAAALGTYRRITVSAAEEFHPELSSTAFHLARWLNANGPARQSELADTLELERSVVSSTVGKMRKLEYVVSDRDPDNLGAVIVSITDLGREAVERAAGVRTRGFVDRIADWSNDDVVRFSALLARFSESEVVADAGAEIPEY